MQVDKGTVNNANSSSSPGDSHSGRPRTIRTDQNKQALKAVILSLKIVPIIPHTTVHCAVHYSAECNVVQLPHGEERADAGFSGRQMLDQARALPPLIDHFHLTIGYYL